MIALTFSKSSFEDLRTFDFLLTKYEIAHSNFATMFTTLYTSYAFIYRTFPYICIDVFEVVAVYLAYDGKG